MSEFKQYRRKGLSEMRDYIPGEDLTGVSVSEAGLEREGELTEPGGKIARNPVDHTDRWYVAKQYFIDNFEEA